MFPTFSCANNASSIPETDLADDNVYYQEWILEDSGKYFYNYFQKNVAGFTASSKGYSVWYSNQVNKSVLKKVIKC